MGGPEPGPVNDVDYSSGPASEVAGMEQLTSRDIEDAARRVVTAAAEACAREFDPGSYCAVSHEIPSTDGTATAYLNRATFKYWVSIGNNEFIITEHPTMGATFTRVQYGNNDPTQPEETQFEWIIEHFKYFHERWPSYPQTMGQHCDSAKGAIQSGQMTAIKPVSDAVDRWTGRAQQQFKEYFLDPFLVNTLTNQQALLDELAIAMYTYEGILKQGRIDAKTIAEQTIDALDSLDAGSGTSFTAVLSVVGIALAVVSTVATAGTTTALTLGLIGAGLQAAQFVASNQEVEGATAEEVLESLAETLDQLRQAMDAEEASIADAVTLTTGQIQGFLQASNPPEVATILPNEPTGGVPNLTDGEVPSEDEFGPRG